MRHQAIMFVH